MRPIGSMVKRQRDFSAGQIDEDALRRDDRPEFAYGIRYGKNCVSGNSGSLKRRVSRRFLYKSNSSAWRDEYRPFAGYAFQVAFSAGLFEARQNGAIVASMAAPWTAAMVAGLTWVFAGENIFIAGPAPLAPVVVNFSLSTGLWTLSNYGFALGVNSTKRAPFFRFRPDGITMRPSARFGTITLSTSGPVFTAQHVGTYFRWVGKQVYITAVTNAYQATAAVLEYLNPTFVVNVASTSGFSVGEIVESETSGFKGEVLTIINATNLELVSVKNYYELAVNDKLVGPVAVEKILAIVEGLPGATVQWDEEFISAAHGYPQSVSADVERLIFCNFPQAPNFIFWSAISSPFDGYLDGVDTSAMLEYIPLQCQVFHVIGGYDEFALTDAGAYYIPISGGSPLKPGSVEFRRISSGAISSITPVAITEGVIYVDSTLRQIYSISATGQISRPYQVADITEYHRDLFDNIQSIAASTTDPTIAGRQIYAVNGDGTFVVGKFESSREYVGWFKQYSAGQVKHISSRYDSVIFSVDYGGLHVAEVIDKSASMDCQVNLLTSGAEGLLTLSTGEVLQFSTGHAFQLDEFLLNDFAGQTMQVMADGFYLGDYMIPAGGEVALSGDYVNVSIGFKFDVEVEPLIEDLEGGDNQKQRLRRRKIQKSLMVVKDTQIFRVGSRVYGTYRQGENMDLPVVSRDDTYQHRQPGRSWDPTFRIVQDVPGGFELLELTTEVTV